MDGINRKLKIPPEMRDNAFELSAEERQKRGVGTSPGSLDEALDLAEKSAFVRGVLGPWTFGKFLEVGRAEAAAYREAVTIQVSDWERDRYLHR
jgi:glutamine synthetase